MRERHFISFNIPREDAERIRGALAIVNCEQWMRPSPSERGLPSFEHIFDGKDPRLAAMLDLLRRENICPFEWIERVYTDADLRLAPLLRVLVRRKEIDAGGPSHGTTYDLSTGCPKCGTGAVQTSPFYAPASAFPKTGLICASSTEVFVAAAIADALRSSKVTGIELRQVLSSPKREPLPWWQVIPESTMPTMSPESKGIIHSEGLPPCSECQRDGHYSTVKEPEQIVYSGLKITADSLPDVVQTWERFGRSWIDCENFRDSRFAEPVILVKLKVLDIFRGLKVKHACFAPVRIIE